MDFDAPHPEDGPGMVRYGELVVFKTLLGLAPVDEGCAGRQWEIRIIDRPAKV